MRLAWLAAAATVSGCATPAPPARPPAASRWVGPPPEPVVPLAWRKVDGEGPSYRVEGELLNGSLRFVTAEATVAAAGQLWKPGAPLALPGGDTVVGTGLAPRGLPPEFAFWLGLADLFRQQTSHGQETRASVEEEDEARALRLDARSHSTFEPAAGLRCSTSMRRSVTDGSPGDSPLEAVERLYHLSPSDTVREQLGLLSEKGWLSWSMSPGPHGGHVLRLHVSGDTGRTYGRDSTSWSLVCSSAHPVFAQAVTGYAASARETPDGWSASVAPGPNSGSVLSPPAVRSNETTP